MLHWNRLHWISLIPLALAFLFSTNAWGESGAFQARVQKYRTLMAKLQQRDSHHLLDSEFQAMEKWLKIAEQRMAEEDEDSVDRALWRVEAHLRYAQSSLQLEENRLKEKELSQKVKEVRQKYSELKKRVDELKTRVKSLSTPIKPKKKEKGSK